MSLRTLALIAFLPSASYPYSKKFARPSKAMRYSGSFSAILKKRFVLSKPEKILELRMKAWLEKAQF
jgi:hypothetical protein